jgi:hypothetical protein
MANEREWSGTHGLIGADNTHSAVGGLPRGTTGRARQREHPELLVMVHPIVPKVARSCCACHAAGRTKNPRMTGWRSVPNANSGSAGGLVVQQRSRGYRAVGRV